MRRSPDKWGRRLLLCIAIAVLAFVAWELAGLDPEIPWHTVTFWAVHNEWLATLIGVLILLTGPVGFVVWEWHIRRPVYKEQADGQRPVFPDRTD